MLFRLFSKYFFKLFGWEVVGEKPPFKKYIFAVAPHTSQTDFLMGKMYCSQIRIKPRVLIKKESFFFPLGPILRMLGGIPVDRKTNQNLAENMIRIFNSSDDFILTIAPEGTRKRVNRWKKGFYHIAMATNVPICLGFIDFKTKRIGAGPIIHPTGNYSEDLKIIKDFYRPMVGKHPNKFSVGD